MGALAAAAVAGIARRAATDPAPPERADDLTVLAANVWHGRADTGALAALLERERPDLVALSESGCDYRDKLVPMIDALGYRAWVSTPPGVLDGFGVTLLAGPRAGEVTVTAGGRPGHLRATGGLLGARSFLAVHTASPTSAGRVRNWRRDLARLAGWSHEPAAPVIAGDLNATVDHARLRAVTGPVRSAAEGTGHGLAATFPTALRPSAAPWRRPAGAGIQIDHVLVPAGTEVSRFAILDVPGSDHRAVLARMRLPRG